MPWLACKSRRIHYELAGPEDGPACVLVNGLTQYLKHSQAQTQTLTEQSKALAELVQKIALAGARPLQEGVAKAFTRAA